MLGGLLRWWLMRGWESGYYYGPDSGSYWHAVFRHFSGEHFVVSGKRPWLYPVLMLLTPHGPQSPAHAAALLQHLIGLLTVVPLAALLRHSLPGSWRWWVIPCTVLFACHPQLVYWEHVLIADSLFTALALLAVAAFCRFWRTRSWVAFGVVLGVLFLSMAARPVGRALWLPMLPLLLLIPALSWRRKAVFLAIAAALYPVASSLTHVDQGDNLLLGSTFPLVNLDSPPYLEIKKELAPAVLEARKNLWLYVTEDQRQTWSWMMSGNAENIGKNYVALVKDKKRRKEVVDELPREALRKHPFTYAGMVAMKLYYLGAQNTKCYALLPRKYESGQAKFLKNSLGKVGEKFPAFMLGNARAETPEGLKAVLREQSAQGVKAQERVLALLPYLVGVTRLYSLPKEATAPSWPRHATLLVLFLIGACAWPFLPKGVNFLPILTLGLGYLALTMVVGRAVERYRLPGEFLFFIGIFVGLDAAARLLLYGWKRCRRDTTSAPATQGKSSPADASVI